MHLVVYDKNVNKINVQLLQAYVSETFAVKSSLLRLLLDLVEIFGCFERKKVSIRFGSLLLLFFCHGRARTDAGPAYTII